MTDGTNLTDTWDGDVTDPSSITFYLRCAHNHTDGSATIKGVTIGGKGDNPFGSDNC